MLIVNKNLEYPIAIQELKEERQMPEGIQLRQVKYLNNIVEQGSSFIKKRIRLMLGLKSLGSAKRIIAGIEAMHMIKKADSSKGEVCPKSKRIHPSTVWTSCLRPGVTRNLLLFYIFFKYLHQNPINVDVDMIHFFRPLKSIHFKWENGKVRRGLKFSLEYGPSLQSVVPTEWKEGNQKINILIN